jgi:nucleoside diphosphate kinase
MMPQHPLRDQSINCKIYNFMEMKKRKPFYKNPIKLTVGSPINKTFIMLKNVVFMERQILALKQELDSNTIILVEATIKSGQLVHISRLPEEFWGEVSSILEIPIS